MRFRVGRHLGRTIYRMVGEQPSDADVFVGIMDTVDMATTAVAALNSCDLGTASRDLSLPQTCLNAEGEECSPSFCVINGPHYVTHPEVPR